MKKIIVVFILSFLNGIVVGCLHFPNRSSRYRSKHSEESLLYSWAKNIKECGFFVMPQEEEDILVISSQKKLDKIDNSYTLQKIDDLLVKKQKGLFVVTLPPCYGITKSEKVIVKTTSIDFSYYAQNVENFLEFIEEKIKNQKKDALSEEDIQNISGLQSYLRDKAQQTMFDFYEPTEQEVEQAYKNLRIPDKE